MSRQMNYFMGDVIKDLLQVKPNLNISPVTEKDVMDNNNDMLWYKDDDTKHRPLARAALVSWNQIACLYIVVHARHGHRGIAVNLSCRVRRAIYFRPTLMRDLREYMLSD